MTAGIRQTFREYRCTIIAWPYLRVEVCMAAIYRPIAPRIAGFQGMCHFGTFCTRYGAVYFYHTNMPTPHKEFPLVDGNVTSMEYSHDIFLLDLLMLAFPPGSMGFGIRLFCAVDPARSAHRTSGELPCVASR